jgi:hypothetical protein
MLLKLKFATAILFVGLITPQLGHATPETQTCKVKTADIGTIIGHGKTSDAAFENAITSCFELREKNYIYSHGFSADEDTKVVMIDVCANIVCES